MRPSRTHFDVFIARVKILKFFWARVGEGGGMRRGMRTVLAFAEGFPCY
jgi:hypothetical protein